LPPQQSDCGRDAHSSLSGGDKPMPDVLITGAAGFLGRGIVQEAAYAGLSVRAVDKMDFRFEAPIECSKADILDTTSLRQAMTGVAAVIHAAGLAHCFGRYRPDSNEFRRINENGTANVAQAAIEAGVQHLVLISSVSVYGGSPAGGADENAECRPQEPYAESKWRAEQRAREITERAGVKLTILRLTTLYGEGDPGNIGRLMRWIDSGRFLWIGHGLNQKSLLHRDDAARACLLTLKASTLGASVFNVTADPCYVRDIVGGLARFLGCKLPRWHFPENIALRLAGLLSFPHKGQSTGIQSSLQKWLADDVYLGKRFEQAHGFKPQIDLEEGLRREVAWYRNQDLARSRLR
jgi:nucleoside-diphosphate-sugar epimerase